MNGYLSPSEFLAAEGVEDWRVLGDGANAFFSTASLAESARLVQAISEVPGVDANPPALDVRVDGVTARLVTFADDHGGMTRTDLEVARGISEVARDLGLAADPSGLQSMLVVPGAPDLSTVLPFWRAVLGYVPRRDSPDEDLVDPHDRNVPFWFEQMLEPRSDGGGAIHVAVWVPYEQAGARLAAALAAGGHVVRDDFAPAWWTLADAAGNEVDISTIESRG